MAWLADPDRLVRTAETEAKDRVQRLVRALAPEDI